MLFPKLGKFELVAVKKFFLQVRGRKQDWSPLYFVAKGGLSDTDAKFIRSIFHFSDAEFAKFERAVKASRFGEQHKSLKARFMLKLDPKRWAVVIQRKLAKRRKWGYLRVSTSILINFHNIFNCNFNFNFNFSRTKVLKLLIWQKKRSILFKNVREKV